MDMRLLKQANAVVIGYRRAFSEKVSMSIFDDMEAARAVLERGASGGNEELKAACMEMAKAMGVDLAVSKASTSTAKSVPAGASGASLEARKADGTAAPKPAAAASGVSAAQWAVIQAAAVKVGGPICTMLVGQIKEDGATSFEDAIDKLAEMIGGGSMGAELKREARAGKK